MTTRLNNSIGHAALAKIQEAGAYEVQEHAEDTRIIILPSCTVPHEYLHPDNWDTVIRGGNFRDVKQIIEACGRKFNHLKIDETIFAKSCEKRLMPSPDETFRFWGGPRSGQRYISAYDAPIVNFLSYWEAAYLTTLWKHSIPAEEPQAIIDQKSGRNVQVVVKGINNADASWNRGKGRQPVPGIREQLKEKIVNLGIEPVDFETIDDTQGKTWVIDAARWSWHPHTDCIRKQIGSFLSYCVANGVPTYSS